MSRPLMIECPNCKEVFHPGEPGPETIEGKILAFLRSQKYARSPAEIAEHFPEISKVSIRQHIYRLSLCKLITNVSYGKWSA